MNYSNTFIRSLCSIFITTYIHLSTVCGLTVPSRSAWIGLCQSATLHIDFEHHHHRNIDTPQSSFKRRSSSYRNVPFLQSKTSKDSEGQGDISDTSQNANIDLHHAQSTLDITGVTLKMAFDSTYSVADASEHKSERFTCPESLDMVHKLRRWSDAVLVGRGTVERDNCTLTVRRVPLLPNSKSQPARVIIDPSLKIIDNEYSMFNDGHRVVIYHSTDVEHETIQNNVELVKIPIGEEEKESQQQSSLKSNLSARDILDDLYSKNIRHVMVEGGPATAIQFVKEKLVDRAILVRAPITFIEPVPSGMTNEMFIEAGLKLIKEEKCGDDIIEYWSKDGAPWPSVNEEVHDTWPY